MKLLLSSLVVLTSVLAFAEAECMDSMEYMLGEATKLSFSGFIPSINR
jgi:hypothetical protein